MSIPQNIARSAGMGAAFGFAFFGGEEALSLVLARPLNAQHTLEMLPFYVLVPGLLGGALGAAGFQGIAACVWLWGGFCALLLTGPLGALLAQLGLPAPVGLVAAVAVMLPVVIGVLFLTRERDSLRWGALAGAWAVTLIALALNQWLGNALAPLAIGVDMLCLIAASWIAPQLARLLAQRQPRAGVMAFLVGLLLWGVRLLGGLALDEQVPAGPVVKGAQPPSVVLLVVRGLRADRLGHFGYAQAQTPTLDGLARRSIAFEQAQAATSDPLGGLASLLTGRLPGSHRAGTDADGARPLSPGSRTLAEYLQGANHHTGAVFADPDLAHTQGLDQGFAWVRAPEAIGHRPLMLATLNVFRVPVLRDRDHASAAEVVDLATRWLRNQGPGRASAFLLAVLSDLEPPYGVPRELHPPQPDAGAHYDAQLALVDQAIARLLEAAGKDTWVIVTADTGLNLNERGRDLAVPDGWMGAHGGELTQEHLAVPLLVYRPRNLKPHTVTRAVSTMDVMPTLLELAELAPREGLDGEILPEVFGRPPPEQETAALSQLLAPPAYAVRRGPWKLIDREGQGALYNLVLDPDETEDLSARDPQQLSELTALIPGRARQTPPEPPKVPEEVIERFGPTPEAPAPEAPAPGAPAPGIHAP